MSSRRTEAGAENTYAAAEAWVNCALRNDDSLFTPGEAIWTRELLGELHTRFLDQPDESGRDFFEKLEEQLWNSPAEVFQLMGEVLYVHYLPLTNNAAHKRQQIERVLGWSPSPVQIPDYLVAGLQSKLINIGAGATLRPFQVGTLIESIEQWKGMRPSKRGRMLEDPWEFKNFLFTRRFNSQLLFNNQNTGAIQRELLLHIVFPDAFETIGTNHKNQIANAPRFARFIAEGTTDVDRRITQIRQGIEAERGENFYFYDGDIRPLWRDEARLNPWDEFVGRAKEYIASGLLESNEVIFKAQIAQRLADAREAVLADADDWPRLVKRGIGGNLINGIMQSRFGNWIDGEPEESLLALQKIWAEGNSTVSQRIREFCDVMPSSAISGAGTRVNTVSVLLMGLDVEKYPPFRVTVFNQAYERTGYTRPAQNADEAEAYEHALGFLDRFIEEAAKRDLELRHRLDAQSVVWGIQQGIGPIPDDGDDYKENSESQPEPDLDALSDRTYLPVSFLQTITTLLEEKKQVIFQGPPGTGKTYVAQELAECLSGAKARVTLVQFHPSYAYEDFVQGYRPTLQEGKAGFELREGPFLRAAKAASAEPQVKHFLVIDEINRGNLAKVFGELYFLLEYRDRKMQLQYSNSDEDLSLPQNLYIIGTMNTADRSIALVDVALRRRFYFVEFHPDKEPVKGLLRRYLKENSLETMEWVADLVDQANKELGEDRHAAVGPSHFMKLELNDAMVERIWEHGVLPYIEERLFGQGGDRMGDFALEKLRRAATSSNAEEENEEPGNGATPDYGEDSASDA